MNSKDNIIRFRGYLTFPDSLKVQKAMEKRRWISPFAAISAVTLAATALAIYWMKVGMLFGGFLMVFMGAFMFGGLRLMRNAAAKTQKRVYEKACVKRTGALSADGITIRKNKAVTTLPWDAFERAAALEGDRRRHQGHGKPRVRTVHVRHRNGLGPGKGPDPETLPLGGRPGGPIDPFLPPRLPAGGRHRRQAPCCDFCLIWSAKECRWGSVPCRRRPLPPRR